MEYRAHYQEWLDDEIEVSDIEASAYDPVMVAHSRGRRVAAILQMLRTQRDSNNNPEFSGHSAKMLRHGYIHLYRAYLTHDVRYLREWTDLPQWHQVDDVRVLTRGLKDLPESLKEWIQQELEDVDTIVRYQAAVMNKKFPDLRKQDRRDHNTTLHLFETEWRLLKKETR